MSFEGELAAVLDGIRVEAIHRYGMERAGVIEVSLDLTHVTQASASGNLDVDRETDAFLQREFETFLSHVDALRERFEEFHELETTSFEADTVCERLHLADRSGDAATAFNNGFLAPFRIASERQIVYTKLLMLATEAFRVGIETAENDLLAIATACRNEMGSRRSGGDSAVFFTVGGIVATAVGMFPALPYAATVALGSASLDATILPLILSGSPEPEEDRWDVEGDTAIAILDSAHAAITHMLEKVGEADSTIAGMLNALAGVTSHELTRPAGAATVDPVDREEVYEIFRAGHVDLPAAAAEYDAAYGELCRHHLPESIELIMPHGRDAFMDARTNLAAAMTGMSRSLRDAGHTLVEIANTSN